jgi:hypothetical protein
MDFVFNWASRIYLIYLILISHFQFPPARHREPTRPQRLACMADVVAGRLEVRKNKKILIILPAPS